MLKYQRKISEYILIGITGVLIGALISAKIINSQVKQIAAIDREQILIAQMKAHDLKEGKPSSFDIKEFDRQLKQILPSLGVKLVLREECLVSRCVLYNEGYKITDKTEQVLAKLPLISEKTGK